MKIDRSILQANDQNIGDFGDPEKIESSINHLADVSDANDNGFNSHKTATELDHPDKSVTEKKLGDSSVSSRTVQAGAIGTRELDPALFKQPTTANGVQTKFQSIDERLDAIAVDVKEQGAIGDGVTDDWQAITAALILAETLNCPLYFPVGDYYVSKTVHTRHQTTYHYTPGIKIYGAGKNSRLIGNGEAVPDSSTPLANQALLAVHSSNNTIEELSFERSPVGLYLGQDPTQSVGSHASFNKINKLFIYYTGYAYVMENGEGCYYNKSKDIHMAHFNIGLYLKVGKLYTVPNNNRNYFEAVRVTRGWIGYLIENGDGNTFNGCFSEGVKGDTMAVGGTPSTLPVETGGQAIAWVLNANGTNNKIYGMSNEDCPWDIYDNGFKNDYLGIRVNDDSTSPKVIFKDVTKSPKNYIGGSVKIGNLIWQPNIQSMFGNQKQSGLSVLDGNLWDDGYHRKTHDLVTAASAYIASVTTDTKSSYWSLGKIREWWVKAQFTPKAGIVLTDPIKITLPIAANTDLKNYGTRPPMNFPVIIQTNQIVIAKYDYASDSIIIPAPSGGWVNTQYNYLDFSLRYY